METGFVMDELQRVIKAARRTDSKPPSMARLSSWIHRAVDDANRVVRAGGAIDMGMWLRVEGAAPGCLVCLAGAMLLCEHPKRVLEVVIRDTTSHVDGVDLALPQPKEFLDPDFAEDCQIARVMYALDLVRGGSVQEALAEFYDRPVEWPGSIDQLYELDEDLERANDDGYWDAQASVLTHAAGVLYSHGF